MKIKLHKRFRGVLSLLVAVMLLVGVMPTQVWQGIKVDAAMSARAYTVFFDRKTSSSGCSWDRWSGVPWVHWNDDNWYPMEWVSKDYYVYSSNTKPDTQIQFGHGTTANTVMINFRDNGIYYLNDSNYNDGNNTGITVSCVAGDSIYAPTTDNLGDTAAANGSTDGTKTDATTFGTYGGENVTAVLYDYYSDMEMRTGQPRWKLKDGYYAGGNLYYSTLDGAYYVKDQYHSTFGGYGWNARRYVPMLTFNDKMSSLYSTYISNHSGQSIKPMYFGDFTDGNGTISAIDTIKTWYGYNSSNGGLSSSNSNVGQGYKQGLYGFKLNSDGKPVLRNQSVNASSITDSNNGNTDLVVPFFDKNFLRGSTQKLGQIYENITFPFVKDSDGYYVADCETYDYRYVVNSDSTKSGIRMTANSSDKVYGVRTDSGIQESAGDFFPFEDAINHPITDETRPQSGVYADKLNYGFGMELTIPFTLRSSGTDGDGHYIFKDDNGNDITFEFKGDDDLVVYVDDYLVLDIGGTHDAKYGKINFSKGWVTVEGATARDSSNNITSYYQNEQDLGTFNKLLSEDMKKPGKHTLKVFYVERGLWESNFYMRYNLPVIPKGSSSITVTETVDTPENITSTNLTVNGTSLATIQNRINSNLDLIELQNELSYRMPTIDEYGVATYPGENVYGKDDDMKYTLYTGNTQTSTNNITGGTNKNTIKLKNSQRAVYGNTYDVAIHEYRIKAIQSDDDLLTVNGKSLFGKKKGEVFTTTWEFTDTAGVKTTSSSSRLKKTTSTSATTNVTGATDEEKSGDYIDWTGTSAATETIAYRNGLGQADLTVSKTVNGTLEESDTFTFTITLDNLAGIHLEDIWDYSGATVTVATDYQLVFKGTITVPAGTNPTGTTNLTISGIPVGTEYTIAEGTKEGYTSVISSDSGNVTASGVTITVTNTKDETLPDEPEPASIVLKIQKVWGTTTVYPDKLKFKVKKSGSDAGVTKVLNAAGTDITSSYNGTTHVLTMTETDNATTVTVDGATSTVWVAYIVDAGNTDIDGTGGSAVTYTITELDENNTELAHQNEWTYTTGSGEGAVTTTFKVNYSFAAAGGGSNTGTYSGPVTATPTNFSTYESTYGDSTGNTLRILTLSAMNSVVPEQTQTNTGGRGGYIPIAGGFIAILLAGAGYFMYRKRIFA